ncbi:PDR/VanB family oxidoreductase [Pseudochelatococcus sp. B33]
MELFDVIVTGRRQVASDITEFVLARADGTALPPFTAGAHIHVAVAEGETRQYSLCSDPEELASYAIAVKREPEGRGGSRALTDRVAEGDVLRVSAPHNDFEMLADDARVLLIAGGIGVTPILAMARSLRRRNTPFRVLYLGRDREALAYVDALESLVPEEDLTVHLDGGDLARAYDLTGRVGCLQGHAIYACGPAGLLHAIRSATAHWPRGSVHFEDFGSAAVATASDGEDGFWVNFASAGTRHFVPADKTILQVLEEAGHAVASSCGAGTCGTCRMKLIEGEADHRDLVLFDDEWDDNIIICCSRAKSREITIAQCD